MSYPLFGLLLMTACVTSANSEPNDETSVLSSVATAPSAFDAIEDALDQVQAGWNSRDVEAIVNRTTNNVTFSDATSDDFISGKSALTDHVAGFFSVFSGSTHTFELIRVQRVSRNVVHAEETVTVTGLVLPDGTPLPDLDILSSTIWVKRGGA